MVGVRNVMVKLTCLYYHHNNYTLHPSTLVALFLLRTVFSPTNTTWVSSQLEFVTFLALPSLQSARESSRASSLLSVVSFVSSQSITPSSECGVFGIWYLPRWTSKNAQNAKSEIQLASVLSFHRARKLWTEFTFHVAIVSAASRFTLQLHFTNPRAKAHENTATVSSGFFCTMTLKCLYFWLAGDEDVVVRE